MKFIELEIKNIASIGYAKISFDSAPLCNEPLFLICGATGSGKSTILDAVCLALYKNAPRLDGYGNESFEDRAFNASADGAVRISDPLQMVRRNTGEAYARLTFIGNDGKRYTASWYAMRGIKKRLDARLKAEHALYCHDTDTTINKDVQSAVASNDVTGLKFEEFCRTTLLAQGAFTRFLNSRSKEKSEILEKLTGTEIYSRIGKQVYATYDEKNKALEKKNSDIDAFRPLPPHEREEKLAAIAAAKKELDTLQGEIAAIEKAVRWLADISKVSESIRTAEQQLGEVQKALSSEAMAEKQRTVAEWGIAEILRSNHSRLRLLLPRQQQLVSEEKQLHERYSQLCTDTAEIGRIAGEYGKRLQEISKSMEVGVENILMYEKAAQLIARMEEMLRIVRGISEKNSGIEQNKESLKLAEQKHHELRSELERVESAYKAKSEAVAQAKARIEKEPSLDSIIAQRKQIDAIAVLLKDCDTIAAAIEQECVKHDRLNGQLKGCETDLVRCTEEKAKAEQEHDSQKSIYEKMHLCIGDQARALKARLSQGDICPVCGEKIKTLLCDEEIESTLRPLKEKLDEAKKALDTRTASLNKATAYRDSTRKLFEECQTKLSGARKEEGALRSRLEEACAALSVSATSPETLRKYLDDRRDELDALQRTRDALTKEYSDLSAELARLTTQINDINKRIAPVLTSIGTISGNIKTMEEQMQASSADLEKLRNELSAYITIEGWHENIPQSIENIRQRAGEYNKAKEESLSLAQKIERIGELLGRVANFRKEIETAYPGFSPVEMAVRNVGAGIDSEWMQLSHDALLCRSEYTKNAEEIAECREAIDTFHEANPAISRERAAVLCALTQAVVAGMQKEIDTLNSDVTKYKLLLDAARNSYSEITSQRPEIDEEETPQILANKRQSAESRRSELEKQLGALNLELKQDDEKCEKLKSALEEVAFLEAEAGKWKRLCDIFGSADGNKFKSIAQSYILLQLLENSNFYLHQFTSRYELTTQPGSLVILIKDLEDNDTIRAANTLSGGESFMVSLALALGLSTLNRNKFTPDTLFIDEGFGTLSGDCLNTVIETLEVLHNLGNRKVGIISHVAELYDRISTKIEVKKQAGVSEVKIVG